MSNTLTLWEENDLTEQLKKSENKPIFAQSDGINEISNVSVKSECCNTGSKQNQIRKCPECNKILLTGENCSRCSRNLKSNEQFIQDCKLVHENKYDYSTSNYVNTRTKINIICSKHRKFSQTPENNLSG